MTDPMTPRATITCDIWADRNPSDPAALAHDPDREIAHAVANERNAIIAFLQHEMQANYDAWESGQFLGGQDVGIALSNAWQDIAQGKHHQEDA